MAACPNCDVTTLTTLPEHIIKALATAAVQQASIISSIEGTAEALKPELVAYLEAGGGSLSDLKSRLSGFVEKKRSFLGAAFGSEADKAKVAAAADVVRAKVFGRSPLDALARSLLQRYDRTGAAHCLFSGDEDALASHRVSCPFRLLACHEPGCEAEFSAAQGPAHAALCPHKIICCPTSCGAEMARALLPRHAAADCPRRPAVCPFASSGCGIQSLTHEGVETHVAAAAAHHLSLTFQRLMATEAALAETKRLAEGAVQNDRFMTTLSSIAAQSTAAAAAIAETRDASTALKHDLASTRSTLASQASQITWLKNELAASRKEHAAFVSALRGAK